MMLSDKNNILQLVALLQAHGIRDIVLCPGSRNAALVHTFSQVATFRLHSVTDERSAGFYAIGLSLQTGLPTVVCVTSGSALLNLHPAAAEAFYQHIPLILISADRPQAWIGQMDGQTLPQPGALGQMVRLSVSLPEGNTPQEEWHINRLCNEAILEATHRAGGPVHINVPVSEPFYEFHTPSLPVVRRIVRLEGLGEDNRQTLSRLAKASARRIILLGQSSAKAQEALIPLLNRLAPKYALLGENLSNLTSSPQVLGIWDGLIRSVPAEEAEQYRPDLVITVCGHLISKPLKLFLRRFPPRLHLHISPDGKIADLFQGALTHVIEARPEDFLRLLATEVEELPAAEYPGKWWSLRDRMQPGETHGPLDAFRHKLLHHPWEQAPVLHLANSSAVRLTQQWQLPRDITVCCNRGVNGIEGSVSTAVGYASACPEQPNFLLIGDLSFFYDNNGLWNRQLPHNLHILLMNSGGGAIFDTLPLPEDQQSRSFICATHHAGAEHLCRHYGIAYLQGAGHEDEFINAKDTILWEIETGIQ